MIHFLAWTPIERYGATVIIAFFIILGWYCWLYKPLNDQLAYVKTTDIPTAEYKPPKNIVSPSLIALLQLHNTILTECSHIEQVDKTDYHKQLYKIVCEGNFDTIFSSLHNVINNLQSSKILSCTLEKNDRNTITCTYELCLYTTERE